MPRVSDRVTCPYTGKRGKVVFISPINHQVYVEFDRRLPFYTYPPWTWANDLFASL